MSKLGQMRQRRRQNLRRNIAYQTSLR